MEIDRLLSRISKACGVDDILVSLTEKIQMSDLNSLLMEVFNQKTKKISISQLYQSYLTNPYVAPSQISPIELLKFDTLAYSLLPGDCEVIELSPLCPLGTCSSLAPVHQNKIISALRNSEVVSDATNVLALECAKRRLQNNKNKNMRRDAILKLATSHRFVRVQSAPDKTSKFTAHFKIFCVCFAGIDNGNYQFEVHSLQEAIDFYLRLLKRACIHFTPTLYLEIYDKNILKCIENELVPNLLNIHPQIKIKINREERGYNYYSAIRFHISLDEVASGYPYLIDGGLTDWTKKIEGNQKARFLISAIGSELLLNYL
ncbi:MAG: hypothetical protein HQK53_13605 [Oligoflexia bacterium]|nr:hypothetical protein [Oligoflexia bacterium]